MNRFDEIQAVARDCADWVCTDPADRNKMADDLIKLVTLVVSAVGKGVAVEGEGDIGNGDCTCDRPEGCSGGCTDAQHDAKAHNRYLMGERMQDGARTVASEAIGADLERYERGPYGSPVWHPTGNAQRLADATAATARREAVAGVDSLLRLHQPKPRTLGKLSQAAVAAADTMQQASQSGPARLQRGDEPDRTTHFEWLARQEASMDRIPDHRYHEYCPGTCCGGNEEPEGTVLRTWDGQVLRVLPERNDCCNPGGDQCGSRCVKTGGCCYLKSQVCPKHH